MPAARRGPREPADAVPRAGRPSKATRAAPASTSSWQVDDAMRTMIHDGAGEHELERYARTLGPSIREDGMRKILAGVTTLEEVVRVTRAD